MTRDDIIRMAREAGFVDYELEDYTPSGYDIRYERFAALVAAAEREACANLCMEIEQSKPLSDRIGWEHGTVDCQVAIRARSQA